MKKKRTEEGGRHGGEGTNTEKKSQGQAKRMKSDKVMRGAEAKKDQKEEGDEICRR